MIPTFKTLATGRSWHFSKEADGGIYVNFYDAPDFTVVERLGPFADELDAFAAAMERPYKDADGVVHVSQANRTRQ